MSECILADSRRIEIAIIFETEILKTNENKIVWICMHVFLKIIIFLCHN